MKHKITEEIQIPEGISCEYTSGILKCRNSTIEANKTINLPQIDVKISEKGIILECKKGSKRDYKKIKSAIAHIKNVFKGLEETFVYKLESCNVHFPVTLKVNSGELLINNFLGEKKVRKAEILKNVIVEVKSNYLTVSSHDKEAAGQTAANIEKATKIRARDRRVYQDGIFITSKPGRKA